MELTNTPATFQRLINQILYPKLDSTVMVYLDNILIYILGTKEEHEKEVKEVLQILEKNDIILNHKKSKLIKKEVIFLEMIIFDKRLRMKTQKTKAIWE